MIIKERIKGDPYGTPEEKAPWLEQRKGTIGGSEIGAILGMNPYKSAVSLWGEKTGKIPPFEGNMRTTIGSYLEGCVADLFSKETGIQVQRTNFLWKNDLYPSLHASPDRMCVGRKAGLEIKTTGEFNAKRFKNCDFPMIYYAQCVQYMAVCEMNEWFLAVLVGNSALHIYQLVRDKEIERIPQAEAILFVDEDEINALSHAADIFLEDVKTNSMPPADGIPCTAEALNKMFPHAHHDTMTLYGRETIIEDYFRKQEEIDKLTEECDEIENKLKQDMQECEIGIADNAKITWKNGLHTSFDAKKCIQDHPEMAKYQRVKEYRLFRIFKKKGA